MANSPPQYLRRLNARRDVQRFNLLRSFLDDTDGFFAGDDDASSGSGVVNATSMQQLRVQMQSERVAMTVAVLTSGADGCVGTRKHDQAKSVLK